MTTISADYDIESTASVLPSGGNALDLVGLCLTKNTRVPIGQVMSFPDTEAVQAFFGSATNEAVIAGGGQTLSGNPAGQGYFGGYVGATAVPGALLFTQYPQTAVAAYLRGGNVSGLTLAQLQALSGSLTVVMDGYTHVIASISFAATASFSAAAAAIQAVFTDPTESSFTASLGASFTATGTGTSLAVSAVTGILSVGDTVVGAGIPVGTTLIAGPTTGGAGTYTTSQATTAATAACTSSSTVLDVTVDTDIAIAVGQTLSGTSITGSPVILSQLSGTPGSIGTYQISGAQQHVASETMTGVATAPFVTFDSVSGAFVITSGITGTPSTAAFATGTLAASLALTSATGAVLSQGAAATTPAAFMNSVIAQTTNWASFFTAFDPDGGNGNTVKLAFAAWTNSVAPRYVYLAWDTDITPTESVPAVLSLGNQVNNVLNFSGTAPIYEPVDLNHAAFIAGAIAAINFNAKNGRITFAFRTQTGIAPAVTNKAAAINLGGNPLAAGSFGNGYNFVGAFGTANQSFVNYKRGTISGPFKWLNSYVFQIWLTNQFQLAAEEYMTSIGSFEYDPAGFANFETAMIGTPQEPGPIQQGLTFGMYAGGVTLSAGQVQEVNQLAGVNIASTLQNQGWYFQVLDPGPTVRASRGSPIIRFFYTDEGDVQALDIASVSAQ